MFFADFILLCQSICKENKRNEKKIIFKKFILGVSDRKDLEEIFFLYKILENNIYQIQIQEKQFISIVSTFLNCSKNKIYEGIQKYGDLAVFVEFESLQNIGEKITIQEIIFLFEALSQINGKNSIDLKKQMILNSWASWNNIEISYFIKIMLGRLNIGLSIKSILEIFFEIAEEIMPSLFVKADIQYAYGIIGDLYSIFNLILQKNHLELKQILPICGKFISCQSSELYLKDKISLLSNKIGYFIQPKLDGFRLQMHLYTKNDQFHVVLYSRNGIDVSYMYPELIEAALKFYEVNQLENIIFDGEVIAYDFINDRYLPFQDIAKRKRKYNIDIMHNLQVVKYIIFDLLYVNNEVVIGNRYLDRFSRLENFIYNKNIEKITNEITSNPSDIDFFYKTIGSKNEGIMIKDGESFYEPGQRKRTWLKYKNIQKDSMEDLIDVVILGYWYAKGARHKRQIIGSLLVGCYDKESDVFLSVAQVGTGGAVLLWQEIASIIDPRKVPSLPLNVKINAVHMPDVLVDPCLVVSLKADGLTSSKDHSSGYSLRFPRLVDIRFDKDRYMTNIPCLF